MIVKAQTALILAPFGRDALLLTAMLAEVGIASHSVDTIGELLSQIGLDAGFVVLSEEAIRGVDLSGLRKSLDAQPEWSDLPFILLTSQGNGIERNPAAAAHLDTLGNVTFLERPFHPTTLTSLAKAALRARQRQYEGRAHLDTIRVGEQRLRVALGAGRLGAWSLTLPARELYTSAQCKAHYGRAPDDAFSFDDLLAGIHPADQARVKSAMQDALGGNTDYDIEYRCVWPNGQIEWVQARGRIDTSSETGPASMSGVTLGITDRKAAEATLQQSEERFRAAVEAVQGVLWTNNAAGEMQGEQRGWGQLTGQRYADYQGYGWASAVHPDDAQPTIDAWNVAVAERRLFLFQHRVRVASGEWRSFSVKAIPAFDSDGSLREWVGVHTDIEDQRRHGEQRQLLLNEMNHRVKNLFSVIGGVVSLSARSSKSPEDMAQTVSGRLNALARAHRLIAPALSNDEVRKQKSTFGELLLATLSPYSKSGNGSDDARSTLSGPEVVIGGEAVTSLALVLHELATNAAKYGAFSTPEGRVEVDWDVSDGKLSVTWQERGGPKLESPPARAGFGSMLSRQSVKGQLGGAIDYSWEYDGLTVLMAVDLERLQP